MLFNRSEVQFGKVMEKPSQDLIKGTTGLWSSSLDDAIKFGGELTREALRCIDLRGDRSNVIVDVKTHMLMPNMCPAIAGWHTDGVPRGNNLDPMFKGKPNIHAQENMKSPHYHLLVTGGDCQTVFLKNRNLELEVPKEPTTDLYKTISNNLSKALASVPESGSMFLETYEAPDSQVLTWDWFELHTAQPAKAYGWRYLIRVTETDYITPEKDLRNVLRTQQQVYLPSSQFGW